VDELAAPIKAVLEKKGYAFPIARLAFAFPIYFFLTIPKTTLRPYPFLGHGLITNFS